VADDEQDLAADTSIPDVPSSAREPGGFPAEITSRGQA
jgi:hypothetical protein